MTGSEPSFALPALLLLGIVVALAKALRNRRRHSHTGRYVQSSGTTPTGKLRASASPDDVERGPGADYAVFKIPDLSASAKKVHVYLTAIADADGYCFPFYRTIARRTGLSSSTVSKAISELEAGGLLTHKQRVSRRGGSSNIYHVKRVATQ